MLISSLSQNDSPPKRQSRPKPWHTVAATSAYVPRVPRSVVQRMPPCQARMGTRSPGGSGAGPGVGADPAELGRNGRAYSELHFSRKNIMDRLEDTLLELAGGR